MIQPRFLLAVDSCAATLGRFFALGMAGWANQVYGVSRSYLVGIAVINLCYGLYGQWIAIGKLRTRRTVMILSVANGFWAVVCLVTAVLSFGHIKWFGTAHLIGEGLIVAWFSRMEWIHLDAICEAE